MLAAALISSAYANTDFRAKPGTLKTNPPSDIYGTHAESGEAAKGLVEVFEVTTGGYDSFENVYGGCVVSGVASGNSVTMSGGEVFMFMSGGSSIYEGDAVANSVTISGGATHIVHGGDAVEGDASANVAVLLDGVVDHTLSGGHSYLGNATQNSVIMSGGRVGLGVSGGETTSGDASANSVTMLGGVVASNVMGGYTDTGEASGNAVTVGNGAVVECHVYGGYTEVSGNASGNTVTLNGEVKWNVYGGAASSGKATGNSVTMNGGHVAMDVYGGVAKSSDASGNTVIMNGGEVDSGVYGGNSNTGNATHNTVIITEGSSDSIYGGQSNFVDASYNTVIMTGGFSDTIYGGAAIGGEKTSNNAVRLVGKGAAYTIGGNTYQGNNVNIKSNVYAGYSDESQGNSVHVYGTGISIGNTISYTQQLNFHLVDDLAGQTSSPMITLGGTLDLEDVKLGFYGDAVTDWTAFDGKTITLVSSEQVIAIGWEGSLADVQIKAEDGAVIATASLGLELEGKSLVLSNIKEAPVPEPATGTLSLLALAGLAARRRRK